PSICRRVIVINGVRFISCPSFRVYLMLVPRLTLLHMRCAQLLPIGHNLCALFKHVTSPIGGLHLVADLMTTRHLRNLAWVICLLGSPVTQTASEPVNSDIIHAHSAQHRRHGHVGQRRSWLSPGKDIVAGSELQLLADDGKRAWRQRHAMRSSCLD